LIGLILERDQQFDTALEHFECLSDILERKYEESEDPEILQKFCIVKSDIARISLGTGDYEAALENSSTALDLSHDLKGLETMKLSSQVTTGLAYYFLGQLEDAIDAFQTVLTESHEDVDVMLLVARALWAIGGDKERDIGIAQIMHWYS
jgi:superkiller protein 3